MTSALALVLSLHVAAGHEPPPRAVAYEQTLRRELEAVAPAAIPAFEEASRLRQSDDTKDLERALALFEQVRADAPKLSHATRRACGVLLALNRRDEAITRCREALAAADLPENAIALARALATRQGKVAPPDPDIVEARALAQKAVAGSNDPAMFFGAAEVALQTGAYDALDATATRLRSLAPDEMATWYFSAIGHAATGSRARALEDLERARSLGLPDEPYAQIHTAVLEEMPFYERWWRPVAAVLAAWIGAFALLIGLGALLSRLTLSQAARPADERSGRATSGFALLRRVYHLVLWLTSVLYYVSLPLVAAAVALIGGGAIYAFFAVGHIPVKLTFLIAIGVLATLWAIVKSLFVRVRDEDPGTRLDLARHPQLDGLLAEVAGHVGTGRVKTVFVTPGTDLAVFERGGILRQVRGSTERCLILGVGLLDGLTVRDVKSVLAHEYGHFSNRDTAGGGFALAVRRSLHTMAVEIARSGAATKVNPAWLFLTAFDHVFVRISHGATRLQEILADRWAAFAYGSRSFAMGLTRVIEQSARFDAHADAALKEVVEAQKPLANLYRFAPAVRPDEAAITKQIEEALGRPASAYDSHPPPRERVAHVERLAAEEAPRDPSDDGSAWSLLSDREQVEHEMTELVRASVERSYGVDLGPKESSETAAAGDEQQAG